MAVRTDAASEGYTRAITGLTGTNHTWALWVYDVGRNNQYRSFIGGAGGGTYSLISMTDVGAGALIWETSSGNISPGVALTTNTWYYIVGVYDSGGTDTLYYGAEGSALSSTTGTVSGGAAGQSFWIANNDNSTTDYHNGRTAGVKIWTAALSAAEIENERYHYAPQRTDNLFAWYPFDAGPDTADYSGNGNTITSIGGTPTYEDGPPITQVRVRRRLWVPAGGGGGVDGTATPGAISVALTVPAVTTQAGATASPAVIARSVTVPAVTTQAGATASPAVIPLSVFFETASVDAAVGPDPIALSVTVPQVVAGGNATVTPATIARTVAMGAVTTQAGSVVTPSTIPLTVTLPAVTASGGGAGQATPATITTAVTIPAATPAAGTTVTPATTTIAVTMPAATGQGGSTASPAVIPLTVVVPAASATGGNQGTATPTTIALSATVNAPTLTYGYQVTPATIQLAVSIAAALASGIVPDAYPITFTMKETGITVTVRERR